MNSISIKYLLRCFGMMCAFFTILQKTGAQSPVLTYARYAIDTLTSSYMNGRGYVDSGDWKAALFIRNEFKNDSLLTFKGSYFQSFSLNTNQYPDDVKVILDNRELTAGKDFLVQPFSSSAIGSFSLYKLEKEVSDTALSAVEKIIKPLMKKEGKDCSEMVVGFQRNQFTKRQLVFLNQQIMETQCFGTAGCIEFSQDKLTWDASQEEFKFFWLLVTGDLPGSKNTTLTVDIDSWFRKNYFTQNVLGYIKGTASPDSFIVFTGHYDHLGQMGDGTYFPGANDNASGISMILNLADHFAKNPSEYSVAFICFSGEELGLVGSSYYADHPQFPLSKIKFLVNLDIVGTGDDGIKVVNATEFPSQFDRLVKLNDQKQLMKVVSPRGKASNSDHYPFYVKGVPCFFIYTMGGIAAYHDIYDRSETLPLTDYEDLFRLLIDFQDSF